MPLLRHATRYMYTYTTSLCNIGNYEVMLKLVVGTDKQMLIKPGPGDTEFNGCFMEEKAGSVVR